jgi:multimeric flavodoxin WrbA
MKVVACNGSPRKDGNTSILLGTVCSELEREGISTQQIHVGASDSHPYVREYKVIDYKEQSAE